MIQIDDLIAAGATVVQRGGALEWPLIAYDSRLTSGGELFVALQTERADGHAFIADAVAAGASGILCAAAPDLLAPAVTVLTSPDVVATLGRWAAGRMAQVAP